MNDTASPTTPDLYRAGAIEIDALQRRMSIDGVPAKLGARAFDVLLALVERRGRIVPKRELMDVVWPRLVVEENNLLVHMVALRKLLGPQAIVTIPGRGYRFALPVDVIARSASPSAASAATTQRGNLPDSPTLFGRAQDLDAVEALLQKHAVVSIVGAGGIGKTRLALAAALATRSDWPDGRWWVELASITDGSQVPSGVAAALGDQFQTGSPPLEVLAFALAGKSLLLVLDSCEHLADEVAALVDDVRLRAPGVHLLITSQESLKCRDEQVYRLGALAIPASLGLEEAAQCGAIQLFVERAHAVDSRFRLAGDNVDVVVDICRRLDGIPLAIELAAARVPLLGVRGLQARLNQRFHVLTGGMRMKLRRHQTLRAALEWSHGLLSPEEQTVFRRVGVFAGGFTLELAQQVVSDERIDRWQVLDLLGHLIDKSLLLAEGDAEPRYRLLDTTRAFALEQLGVAGESDALLRRHAQVLCELMAATDANCWSLSPVERDRAVRELGNLRAALDWATSAGGDRALACELLARCWLLWLLNGLVGEGEQRMLQFWPPSGLSKPMEADFCHALARLNAGSGREEHWLAARRAEALYRELGNGERLGDALLLAATIGSDTGHIQEVEPLLREAELLVTDASPLRKQAALAATQGGFYLHSGLAAQAAAAFDRQRELYRRAGAALGEYLALGNVGSAQLDAGDVDAAVESLQRSVDGLRRLKAPYGWQHRLAKLAIARAWRGDVVDIVPLARESLDFLRPNGRTFTPVMAAALQFAHRGDLQRAVMLAGHAGGALERDTSPCRVDRETLRWLRERATAEYPESTVAAWWRAGERMTYEQVVDIAFEQAPLDRSV